MPLKSGHYHEILQNLESSNYEKTCETLSFIKEQLVAVDETNSIVVELIDYYIQSGNTDVRNLLTSVNRQQSKTLLIRLDEHMQKATSRIKALGLLGHIIRKEPNWIHEIIPSKTVFVTLQKCLLEDTDIPIITSAVYVLVTFMPKVASQLSIHLQSLCKIFLRLVSWHTIKPEGVNDANLVHLHAAVYAFFISLYAMFPCHLTQFVKEVYKAHIQSMEKQKGSRSFKDKLRIFENSIQPLLDQVRFNPSLIVDSLESEIAAEKWRKLASQDIVANIQKISLDATENTNKLESFTGGTPLRATPTMKTINNLSPSAQKEEDLRIAATSLQNLIVSQDDYEINEQFCLLETCHATPDRTFVPNSCSPAPGSTTHADHTSSDMKPSTEACVALNFGQIQQKDETKAKASNEKEPCKLKIDIQVNERLDGGRNNEIEMSALIHDISHPAVSTTDGVKRSSSDDSSSRVELSPNELRDLHLHLMREAYFKNLPKYADRGQDNEWRFAADSSSASKSSSNSNAQNHSHHHHHNRSRHNTNDSGGAGGSDEVNYLRSQVLQAHFAMLYERHKREQHALRARKYIRKLYNTQKVEEQLATMTKQLQTLSSEVEGHIKTKKVLEQKHSETTNELNKRYEQMKVELATVQSKLGEKEKHNCDLLIENEQLQREVEDLHKRLAFAEHKNFEYEQQNRADRINRKNVAAFEKKLNETKMRMRNVEMRNEELEMEKRLEADKCAAQIQSANALIASYEHKLDSTIAQESNSEEVTILKRNVDKLEEALSGKKKVISLLKSSITRNQDLASVQLKAVEEKFAMQRKVNQRLELELLRMKHQFDALSEVSKSKNVNLGEVQLLDSVTKCTFKKGPEPCLGLKITEDTSLE